MLETTQQSELHVTNNILEHYYFDIQVGPFELSPVLQEIMEIFIKTVGTCFAAWISIKELLDYLQKKNEVRKLKGLN